MNKRETMRQGHLVKTMQGLGFSFEEVEKLRRISITLSRWAERECNGEVQRDETTGKPFAYYGFKMDKRTPVADREKGALKRLAAIMADHPTLNTYIQGDPRGAALYILRPGDVPEGQSAACCYSRGICVY